MGTSSGLPLGTTYLAIVSHVGRLPGKLPAGTELVIDDTGVGRPIYDLFTYSGISPVGVMITAGRVETQEGQIFGAPKLILVSRLHALLHEERLKIQRELPEADALVRELQDFRVEFSAAGNLTFNARQDRHDDLVLALAIAAWRAYGPVGRGMNMFELMRREAAKLAGADEPSKMVVGIDLGQAHDPTAIAVIHRVPTWRIGELPDPPPPRRPPVATTYAIGSVEWAREQALKRKKG